MSGRRHLVLPAFCFAFALTGCGSKHVDARPPQLAAETFCDMVYRTEGLTCEQLAAADTSDGTPAPDPREIYDQWNQARQDVARINAAALNVRMDVVWPYRPKLYWIDGKAYPLVSKTGLASDPQYVRATVNDTVPALVQYAWPELLRHEFIHIIARIVFGQERRTAEAIAEDPGQEWYDGPPFEYLWQVTCHNTPDDPFGEGPARKRDGCIGPYAGPVKPAN